MKNEVKLYSKNSLGSINQWRIWSDDQYIYMDYGRLGGESVTTNEFVPMGLSTRTLEEQIESRINSRVNKKLDSGYVYLLKDAENNERRNSLGYKFPSKCLPWGSAKKSFIYDRTYVQSKLDGHHCNIVNDNGTNVAYSSNGKIIDTIPEILNSIKIPVGRTIEGELYHHGTPLQTISSWVKKRQEETKKLKFIVYEVDLQECYSKRLDFLNNLLIIDRSFAHIHETDLIIGKFNILELTKQKVEQGYEGLVVRPTGHPHADGRRTKGSVKVKPIHFKGEFAIDDEFLVINILSSNDGWARLQCITEAGNKFMVSSPGSIPERTYVLKNKETYINKHVEIEFAGYTKRKVPQHPVALRWREKFDE